MLLRPLYGLDACQETGAACALAVVATAAVPAALLRGEAVGAVDRLVAARLGRHLCLLPAGGAGGRVHLPLLAPVAATRAITTAAGAVATTRAIAAAAVAIATGG